MCIRDSYYVRGKRAEWTANGRELDGALALRALLAFHVEWSDVADVATELASRAIDEALWQTATLSANETLAQSCRTAQIASDLLEIAWFGVRANISALLSAISLGAEA